MISLNPTLRLSAQSARQTLVCIFCISAGSMLVQPTISSAQTQTSLNGIGVSSDELRTVMEATQKDNNLPSLSVAIVLDTTIVFGHAVGYANLGDSLSATTQTIYRIGSVTKPITVTMLVKLAEEGVLRLDDPVSMYIPEYRVKSRFPGTQPTTLRQLASHRSGLPRNSPYGFLVDLAYHRWIVDGHELQPPPERTREQFVASLSELELEYRPNDLYGHYSNLGFKILGLALEQASGQEFDDYVVGNILLPLGMTRSGFDPASFPEKAVAVGYVYPGANSEPLIALRGEPGIGMYAGGVYSTAEDLCRFLSLHFQAEEPGGGQIISGDGLRMMLWSSMDWAFAWDTNHPALEHGGGLPGFGAHVIIIPGLKLGIAVLTNSLNVLDPGNPCKSIAWKMVKMLKPGIINRSKKSTGPDTVSIENYVGTYILSKDIAKIDILLHNDTLLYRLGGLESSTSGLYPCSTHTFCFEDDTAQVYQLIFDEFLDSRPNRLSMGEYHFLRSK